MKKSGKVLAIVLAALMIIQSIPVLSFAAGDNEKKLYKSLTVLGDSVAAGYDSDTPEGIVTDVDQNLKNSPSYSFPRAAGRLLGLQDEVDEKGYVEVYNLGYPGGDTKDIYDVLTDPEHKYHNTYVDTVSQVDLIGLNIGNNDFSGELGTEVFAAGTVEAYLIGIIFLGTTLGLDLADLMAYVEALANGELVLAAEGDTEFSIDINNLIKAFGLMTGENLDKVCDRAYKNFTDYYEKEVDELIRLKKDDAQVILIGLSNPYGQEAYMDQALKAFISGEMFDKLIKDTKLLNFIIEIIGSGILSSEVEAELQAEIEKAQADNKPELAADIPSTEDTMELTEMFEDFLFPLTVLLIGEGAEKLYNKMNAYMQDLADKKGLTYVDTTGTPLTIRMDPHPDAEGHEYIAEKIADAVTPDITASVKGSGGKISNNGTTEYRLGTDAEYIITPDKGYRISKVTVDGRTVAESKYANGSYTFEDVRKAHTIQAEFEKKSTFTLTFDTDGGSEINSAEYNAGDAITKPENPSKEGYTFAGWENLPETMPAADITATAKWTANKYTIRFNTNGGSTVSPITLACGANVTAPANPTKEGYTFNGWENLPKTMPSHDITATAKWTVNQYTITFNTDGGNTIAPITQNYGTVVTAPANPTKSGYTFKGWSEAIPATMPAVNKTITALWTSNGSGGGGSSSGGGGSSSGGGGGGGGAAVVKEYTVTFNTNGGTAIDSVTVKSGKSINLDDYSTAKDGSTFDGWYLDSGFTKSADSLTPDKDLTVYAKWNDAKFTLSGAYSGYSDVNENEWYGTSNQGVIKNVTLLGIMNGDGDGKFRPAADIKLSEVIKMAAVVNNIYNGKTYSFKQASGSDWYKEYVEYAISKGIINSGDFDSYTRAATRAEMAYIFAKAVPADYLPEISSKTAPDVQSTDKYAAQIQMLYKAGVLEGSDEAGNFKGSSNITRAEAAAIITRIALPETRITD